MTEIDKATKPDVTALLLAEQRRTNKLLELLANRRAPRNFLESIGDWWRREKARSMRVDY